MDFFTQTGKMALGSRLRMLSDNITEEAAQLYQAYQVDLKPKWFPVFFVLSKGEQKSITAIAEEIGHSHPSVSVIVREMARHGIVSETKDKTDKRKNVIALTEKGRKIAVNIQPQYQDVNKAIDDILSRTQHNIWNAIEELEFLLQQKSLRQRVLEQKKKREARAVKIVPYSPQFRTAFKTLNAEWIDQYFEMEAADLEALDHPEDNIINKGGFIFVALYEGEPVGVCALKKSDDPAYPYELSKMAVTPRAQGKGIGWLLGKAVVDKARELGAEKLFLESNTKLKPAINLYLKLGFKKISGRPTPFARSNIQMELDLT